MDFSVNTIISKLKQGGARGTLFSVQLISPFDATLGINSPFMCHSASLPGSSIGEIQIPFMGRKIKAAGDRTFADWSVTVYNDEDFAVKKSIDNWINAMQGSVSNIRNSGADASFSYKAQAIVSQYGKEGGDAPIAQYTFYGLFPKTTADIPLNWGGTESIEEFTVTFAVDYFLRTI